MITVFVILIKKSSIIKAKKKYHKELGNINTNELQAIDWKFDVFENGEKYLDPEKPYLYDLDIFGEGSVFQYLNRSATLSGESLLAAWFTKPKRDKEEIESRQVAVVELAPLLDWRQEFQARGRIISEDFKEKEFLYSWLDSKNYFSNIKGILILIKLIPTLSIIVILLLSFGIISSSTFILYLLIPLGISARKFSKVNKEQRIITKSLVLAKKYAILLSVIENGDFKSKRLGIHQYFLRNNKTSASKKVEELAKLISGLDNRNNMIMGIILNALFIWDLQYMVKLEKWRNKNQADFKKWIDIIADFDSLSSLANLSYNFPNYIFADIYTGNFKLEAINTGHILINSKSRISNTFNVSGKSIFTIITGANMAGKSTFLRTIGVNMILGMVGAPICASRFSFTPIDIFTSMRTTDSLFKNESYFYAELSRLKILIDSLRSGKELFIILDEVLKGTNSKDKSEGSKALVKQLINMKTSGIIATHDVSLGNLKLEFPVNVNNNCFEVEILDNKLVFDYKLKDGISQNLNATFLMKNMGITI